MMERIPLMGFGTMEFVDGSAKPESLAAATTEALKAGYRHLDCAEMYQSTLYVKQAIAESKIKREELWVTSKLKGLPSGEYKDVEKRVDKILGDLGVDKLDLLLIHWPGPGDEKLLQGSEGELAEACNWKFFAENIKSAWENMQRLKEAGKTRFVGVSNFYEAHLKELIRIFPKEKPYANEIYIDAIHQEVEFVRFMQANSIQPIAYRAIAFVGTYAQASALGDTTAATLNEIGSKLKIDSPHALVLACLMKKGICVLPKSKSKEHIKSNFAAQELVDKVQLDSLKALEAGSATADMLGAADTYAATFKDIKPPAESKKSE